MQYGSMAAILIILLSFKYILIIITVKAMNDCLFHIEMTN